MLKFGASKNAQETKQKHVCFAACKKGSQEGASGNKEATRILNLTSFLVVHSKLEDWKFGYNFLVLSNQQNNANTAL